MALVFIYEIIKFVCKCLQSCITLLLAAFVVTNEQRIVTAHRFSPQAQVSVPNPNLPITVLVENGITAHSFSVSVAGRQYGVLGRYTANRRINGDRRTGISVGTGSFAPTVSFRRKSSADFVGISLKLEGIDVISDTDAIMEVRLAPTLTGASWQTPTNTSPGETALESDLSATGISGGELIYQSLISGGSKNNASALNAQQLGLDIPEEQIVSAVLKAIGGSGTAHVDFRMREEW